MMKTKTVKISDIKTNPNNPRLIKDDKFKKLVKSIQDFPQMLEIRPIVVNQDMIVLGGNMRLKACKEAGLKEIPIIYADDLTEDQQRQFIIKDNVGFGEWDWEMIANEWNAEQLDEWGLDVPDFAIEPDYDDLIGESKDKPATLKITFESPEELQKAEIDIQELLDRKYPNAYFSVSAGEI
jgi:ParB-like chromosome segregation protein Spo0J